MTEAFGVVVFVVVGLAAVIAVVTLAGARRSYDEIGRSGLALEDPAPAERGGGGSSAVADAEIRQMLEARNARRARRGEPPVDVEAELARLTAPVVDDEVRAEVRALVQARNARRVRAGREPLDEDAEVARRLDALRDVPQA